MKTVKLYGEKYEIEDSAGGPVDAYAYKGDIVDTQPKGKLKGYVTYDDGSILAVYKSFNPLNIIIPILLVLFIGAAVFVYFYFIQPKDLVVSGFTVKQGDDQNIISYNGFMSLRDDNLNLNFQNGSEPVTLTIYGDGIATQTIQVEPEQFVASVPATFTTDSGVVNAKIKITTPTSEQENDCVIEIPENNTPNSVDSPLNGYWEGEFIYGVE